MAFWRCYYHVIWATQGRQPLITPDNETLIFNAIQSKAAESDSTILAINAVSDHIHVAVSIPPKVAVAQWVKDVKGPSSREVNMRFPDAPTHFRWQDGYSVLTFGAKQVEFVVGYIKGQKEHHAAGTLEPYLEHLDNTD